MGDPRKTRSNYKGPRHPWNKDRIESEKKLVYTYGLTNKKELWKVESKVTTYKDNAKKLLAQNTKQAEKELSQLFGKLQKYGLMKADATADDVLGMQTEQLLDRRLQTLVHKHNMAHSTKQARQFITHGHILVAGKKMTVPSYLVPLSEESTISFNTSSALFTADHPERVTEKKPAAGKTPNAAVEAKTAKEKAAEPAPVTETEKTTEAEKPIEQKIEEETDNAAEVAEAVEQAEADNIAEDHEQAIKKAAEEESKEKSPKKKDDKKGDAQ